MTASLRVGIARRKPGHRPGRPNGRQRAPAPRSRLRVIRRVPVPGAAGFRSEEFRAASTASPAIIFICPYSTSISALRWAIRRLRREGYHVVAYETTTAVFMAGDPAILPDLISAMRKDIKSQISRLKSEGVTEFGFFGSSLGSFILYNCIGDALSELRWGVFNTGGDIAQGMWRLDGARRQHVLRGWSLPGSKRHGPSSSGRSSDVSMAAGSSSSAHGATR